MKTIAVLTWFVVFGMCFNSVCTAQNRKTTTLIKPIVVVSGADSHVRKPYYQRVTAQKDWDQFWASHLGTRPDDAYRPHLDVEFGGYMVVVIFRGDRINVRGINLDSSFETKDAIVLRIDDVGYQTGNEINKRPDRPYAFVVLPRSNKLVVLEENDQNYKDESPKWKEFARLQGTRAQLKN